VPGFEAQPRGAGIRVGLLLEAFARPAQERIRVRDDSLEFDLVVAEPWRRREIGGLEPAVVDQGPSGRTCQTRWPASARKSANRRAS
jgi:hypothetical protein